jgi:hypothetical protein
VYAGVPDLQGADRGPWAHLERGCEPIGEANFSAPRSVILNFLLASQRRAPGGAGTDGLGAPTINAKKRINGGPREVPELEIQKLETSMAGPLGVLTARSDSVHHQS